MSDNIIIMLPTTNNLKEIKKKINKWYIHLTAAKSFSLFRYYSDKNKNIVHTNFTFIHVIKHEK